MNTTFEIDEIPRNGMSLKIEGLDDEKPERAFLEIKINSKVVFSGVNTFGEDDWSTMSFDVPAAILKKGENSFSIANTTKDKTAAPAYFEQPEAPVQDYHWGWFMISDVALLIGQ